MARTVKAGLFTPLEGIMQHWFIRNWDQRLRKVNGTGEWMERSTRAAKDNGLEADTGWKRHRYRARSFTHWCCRLEIFF